MDCHAGNPCAHFDLTVSYTNCALVDIIMSDSEHSTVTYTSLSEDDSDIGSPGVDGPPIMPEDPYAYIMAAYGVPPSPDYIPGPDYPADRDDDDDEEEEEEHLAPADFVPPVHRMTARISIRDEPSISLPLREEV
ncbi:hypothetical protein Tco_0023848, partial [Tanacetum coccineum]